METGLDADGLQAGIRCVATGCSTPELHATERHKETGWCRGLRGPSGHAMRIPDRIGTRLNGAARCDFQEQRVLKLPRMLFGSA